MKSKLPLLILATAIVIFILIAGCSQPQQPAAPATVIKNHPAPQETPTRTSSNPLEYFPMKTGDEWSYTITPGYVSPMIYEQIFLVQGEKISSFPYRQIVNAKPGQAYNLKLRVKGPFRGGQRLDSVDLEILSDQMGLFRDTTGVYWGIMDNPTGRGVQAMELAASYSAVKLMATYPYPQLKTANLVHSYRMIFIWDGYKLEREGGESITYLGMDSNVPGYSGIPCYHFLREVPPDESLAPQAKAFSEHTWYAKGKGLVRLEQKIDGRISMVWVLDKFTPGEK